MKPLIKVLIFLLGLICLTATATATECVITLHGMGRTANSMNTLAKSLQKENYLVYNIDYPSRTKTIEELAEAVVKQGLDYCEKNQAEKIYFVTHSLGGLLVRYYFSKHSTGKLARVVMLGPPNKGSQVADNLQSWDMFKSINGPAGQQLSTSTESFVNQLPAANFDVGIIAGTKTFNPILSLMLPNPDDGKVTLENTKIDGMKDFIALPVTHTFMMKNNKVIGQVIHFLKMGQFNHENKVR
jgi:predicted alpha/beta hydrolase family esterase